MLRPHWLNEDGSLKSGVAYWVYENFNQWDRGFHYAHVHKMHEVETLRRFREFHFYRSMDKRRQEAQSVNLARDPRAFVLALRRGENINLEAR